MNNLPFADEQNERRICPRFSPSTPLRVNLNSMGAEESFGYDLVDISESGIRVKCRADYKRPFVSSSLIEAHVEIPEDNEEVSFLTKLQRDKEQADSRFLALRIVQIAVRDREVLRRMIDSHLPTADNPQKH